MGGGSGATQTTTSKQTLSPEQQHLLDLSMPKIDQFAASDPQLHASTADFTDAQKRGQQMVLNSAGGQQGVVGSNAAANQRLTSGSMLDPNTNPALRATIDAAVRPITQQLTENTLPALRSEGATVGSLGGSREGIAEGLASQAASRQVGDTSAGVATSGYNSGLNAMVQAMGLAPGAAGALALPGATTSTVGDVQQNQAQQALNTENQKANYAAWLPYLQGSSIMGLAGGIPGGGTTSTGSVQANPSLLNQIGGGASIFTSLFGGGGKSPASNAMALFG